MGTSIAARLFMIGLWGECDDQGIFQWKPLTLKARIMPADSVDIATLLEELGTKNFIKKFSHGGAEFGVVRNFCRFQRPKKPTKTHYMPPEYRTYAGLTGSGPPPDDDERGGSSPPVPHQSRTSPTDGGERRGIGGGEERSGRGPQAVSTLPLLDPKKSSLEPENRAREEVGALSSGSSLGLEGRSSPDNAQAVSGESVEARRRRLEDKLAAFRAREAASKARKTAGDSGPPKATAAKLNGHGEGSERTNGTAKPNGAAHDVDSDEPIPIAAAPPAPT